MSIRSQGVRHQEGGLLDTGRGHAQLHRCTPRAQVGRHASGG